MDKVEEEALISYYTSKGYKITMNDERVLGFSFYIDEDNEPFVDYLKKENCIVRGNAKTRINLVQKKTDE